MPVISLAGTQTGKGSIFQTLYSSRPRMNISGPAALLFTVLFIFTGLFNNAHAQKRFSMLTCGVGQEIYASFGHAAIRVTDSVQGTDLVYNWGTFNGFEEGFEIKFMRGKLLYYCSVETFHSFMRIYVEEGRTVWEQPILLNEEQKMRLSEFLSYSTSEENKYYKYDFLFDNCATRIRDVFPQTYGKDLKFWQTVPPDRKITFRQIINHYLAAQHWQLFGINILLGSRVDGVMSNSDIMFLPDYLRTGLAGATIAGQPVSSTPKVILPGQGFPKPGFNWAAITVLLLSVLMAIPLLLRPSGELAKLIRSVVLVVTGLLGVLIAFMWFGTDHGACQENWNILWANPVHLIYPLFRKKAHDRYAIISIGLIMTGLLLNIFRVQSMPLLEAGPWMALLLIVFGTIFRTSLLQKRAV